MKPDFIDKEISDFLDQQGLSFKPLRAEILDHLISDVADRVQSGETINEAWEQVKKEIPANHFKHLQQQAMETIDNRLRITRVFGYLFLTLFTLGALFKFMHWPGAGILLLASFVAITLSLISGSIYGVVINKTRKGSIWVLTMILGIVLLLMAFSFRIIHYPGVEIFAVLSVVILILSAIKITWDVNNKKPDEGSLFTYLHEKYTPGIQRSLLILLTAGALFKGSSIISNGDYYIGDITLFLIIYGAGTQLLSLFWRAIELNKPNQQHLLFGVLSAICLFLPVLNFYIPLTPRLIFGGVFYLTSGLLVYQLQDAETNKTLSMLVIALNLVHFTLWSLIEVGVIQESLNYILYNLPITGVWIAAFWVFRKDRMVLTYLMITFAAYSLQYVG